MIISKKRIVALIEMGSCRVTCLVAEIMQPGIRVLSCASLPALGIKSGVVSNYAQAQATLSSVVESAEKEYGKPIEEAYVLTSGGDITSTPLSLEIQIGGREITERDIRTAHAKMVDSLTFGNERVVVHSVINSYLIDGLVADNPLGMCANRLETSINFISTQRIPLLNINQVLASAHIEITSYLLCPYIDSFFALSQDDKSIGATVINLGAQNTSVITFKNGALLSCSSLPVGGDLITHDIAYAFGTSILEAEKLKVSEGDLDYLDENDRLMVEGRLNDSDGEENFITKTDLNAVIFARQEEILEQVVKADPKISQRKVVLIGGGSSLCGIEGMVSEFITSRIIKKQLEAQSTVKIKSDTNSFVASDTSNSSILGALIYLDSLFSKSSEITRPFKKSERRILERLTSWFRR